MPKVKLNGVEFAYEEWGDGEETVVMLHNAPLFRQGMEPLARRLEDRYRILLWDFRGMGESEKPDTEAIGMETLYEDAVTVIRARTGGPVHLVGMSLGGCVALRVAARQPQLLRSLTVLGTSALGADGHAQGGQFFQAIKERGYSDPEIVEKAMAITFSAAVREDPARAQEMEHWAAVMAGTDPRTMAVAHSLSTRLSVEYEMQHIELPTLVIAGAEDPSHPIAEQQEIHDAIRGSRFLVIERCGHTPIVERPEETAAAVCSFLEEVDAVTAAPAA